MSDIFSGVCVGGPLDGKLIASHGPRYCVSVIPERPDSGVWESHGSPLKTLVGLIEYTHRRFGDAELWAPSDLSDAEVLWRLVVAYEKLMSVA